jgi:3-oxoacyl-[acyl-carrier protein] reductase
LGRAAARRLAEEGANLVLGDIDGEELGHAKAEFASLGRQVHTVAGDLTEETTAGQLIDTAMSQFGQIDGLVNNLGGSRNAKIWEMSTEDWDHTLRLNLRGMFLCTRFAVPHMMARKSGGIVCLSSGAREGTPWTAYTSRHKS